MAELRKHVVHPMKLVEALLLYIFNIFFKELQVRQVEAYLVAIKLSVLAKLLVLWEALVVLVLRIPLAEDSMQAQVPYSTSKISQVPQALLTLVEHRVSINSYSAEINFVRF